MASLTKSKQTKQSYENNLSKYIGCLILSLLDLQDPIPLLEFESKDLFYQLPFLSEYDNSIELRKDN